MTTDLWMLAAAVLLQWLLLMIAATPRLLRNGVPWAFGNRDTASVPLAPWALRADRASANLQENLVLFAPLVLLVHVAGIANATTALGAQIFVAARIAHAAVYLAGIPMLRTLVWIISLVGMGMIGSVLLG